MDYINKIDKVLKNTCSLNIPITIDTKLQEDLYLDSFSIIIMFIEIENEFNIDIDFRDIDNVKTIEDVIAVVKKCKSQSQ
ncbi:acyl carrier protein [Sporanaerobacter acetigenes]|uniref:Phosphopantetheine attachment site n=1 Tax=Sporanaerobacter acetigenes DSM 13106 TaxID=1123281 RepID=A0A1M5ZAM9_9FIRM|nr:phosphopantetheine-binding protein [Sporanaerobacter acetigenes]SHI21291.1 Phosphopantetheine attachment site [Sporanaerobacter acetigenes DSM 13106]